MEIKIISCIDDELHKTHDPIKHSILGIFLVDGVSYIWFPENSLVLSSGIYHSFIVFSMSLFSPDLKTLILPNLNKQLQTCVL